MSIDMSAVGYSPAVRTTQAAQYARQEAVTENAGEQSEKAQVDAYESGADNVSRRTGANKISYQMDADTVNQLKADLAQQQSRFLTSVKDMLTQQGVKVAESDGIWKQIASGKFAVDDATRAAAKEATAEDGYWGVKQTSERFVKYAKALTGGDPAKASAMREAFQKGYKAAEKAWGGALPELSQKTYDATMKLFDDWENEADA